jgi:hypothetical protein
MKPNTQQSSNEAEKGNKSKPLLGEVSDFFDEFKPNNQDKKRILQIINDNNVELEFVGFSVFAKPNFKIVNNVEILENKIYNWLMEKKYLVQKEKINEDKYIMKLSKKGIGKLMELGGNFT